uniref:Ig-like domain-containing protein n=1 Tax=Branchiostoma floridae TaxID=7739 RepID=C3ZLK6_BRAFL|eukprot:XP_002590632.1 hypothetical protein BRAFLDRAFT_83714 [Branchiostoma floridae]
MTVPSRTEQKETEEGVTCLGLADLSSNMSFIRVLTLFHVVISPTVAGAFRHLDMGVSGSSVCDRKDTSNRVADAFTMAQTITMISSTHWNYAVTATYGLLLSIFISSATAAARATYRVRPESTAVLINRTVSLRCAFDGLSAKDQVNWYWYNPRSAAKLYHISSGLNVAPEFPRYLIAGNQKKGEFHLKIQNALPEDEGNYRCSVFSVRDAGDAKLTVVGKYMLIV